MKKYLMLLAALLTLCFSVTAMAEDAPAKTLTEKIREANIVTEEGAEAKDRIPLKERLQKILEENSAENIATASNLPKVAIIYVNNAKSTYDEAVDREIFKCLDTALPADTYEIVDGTPYAEKLNKLGYMNIADAERADIIDAFAGEGIDYCIYLEVEPFIARDKSTFFTVGKDITTAVPFKIIDLTTNRYLYVGKFTEKASDSSMIGGIGNKSVALKALHNAAQKITSIIDVRLPKNKTANAAK